MLAMVGDRSIEQIKTVSSTYMAAGPSERTMEAVSMINLKMYRNATMMIEFALAMSQILDQLNRDSFQNFELRIGMMLPTRARRFGAQKPQYDIWGNVTPEMGEILKRGGYRVQSRGKIKVKGVKEPMETFLIEIDSKRNSSVSNISNHPSTS
ncbi:hypothetical protein OSTOST_03663 [Ostertagia ostertagi]